MPNKTRFASATRTLALWRHCCCLLSTLLRICALQQCAAGAVTRTWAVVHLCSMVEFNGVYLSRV
jgi:hypothetical protein